MRTFFEGFEKKALMDTREQEAILAGGVGVLPFGTTAHTVLGERPEGHNRLKEWGGRTLGKVIAGPVGEGAASYMMNAPYYDSRSQLKSGLKSKNKGDKKK